MPNANHACLTKRQAISELQAFKTDIIPFVGAGFTCNISPRATYQKLITGSLSSRIRVSPQFFTEVLNRDVALFNDFAIWSLAVAGNHHKRPAMTKGKAEYAALVKAWFDTCKLARNYIEPDSWLQHIWLVRNFGKIYTTNWDTTLEDACEYHDGTRPCVKAESRWPERGHRRITPTGLAGSATTEIIKLHGDISSPQSLVASESDFHARLSRATQMNSFEIKYLLPDLVSDKRLLFLGYSLTDVNIRYILKSIIELLKNRAGLMPPSYLVSVDCIRPAHRRHLSRYYLANWNMHIVWLLEGITSRPPTRLIRSNVRALLRQLTN